MAVLMEMCFPDPVYLRCLQVSAQSQDLHPAYRMFMLVVDRAGKQLACSKSGRDHNFRATLKCIGYISYVYEAQRGWPAGLPAAGQHLGLLSLSPDLDSLEPYPTLIQFRLKSALTQVFPKSYQILHVVQVLS